MGLGDARRGEGSRAPHAVPERHGVLRPYPPGAPSQDGAYRPSCGEGPDVSAAGARLATDSHAPAVGSGAALQGPRLSQRRGRGGRGALLAHRISGAEGINRTLRLGVGASIIGLGLRAAYVAAQPAPKAKVIKVS